MKKKATYSGWDFTNVWTINEGKSYPTLRMQDKIAPTVSLSKNGGDWDVYHDTTINASDSGSGIDKVEYRWTTSSSFPSSEWKTGANGRSTTTPSSTGNYYLHVKATDKAGNVTKFTSKVFRVDRTVATLTSSKNSGDWDRSHSVTLTANDAH